MSTLSNAGKESHITHRKDQEKMFTVNDAVVFHDLSSENMFACDSLISTLSKVQTHT